MQQRAAIARALVHDPKLVLMDEPFGALDALTREKMNLELLRIWKQSGKTILFVTHGISEAVFLGTRVIVFTAGPARMAANIPINLPEPRVLDAKTTEIFGEYTRRILSAIGFGIMQRCATSRLSSPATSPAEGRPDDRLQRVTSHRRRWSSTCHAHLGGYWMPAFAGMTRHGWRRVREGRNGAATSRHHHERRHRPHGHEPASHPLDPGHSQPGRRGAGNGGTRHAGPDARRPQRAKLEAARQAHGVERWTTDLDAASPTRATPSSSMPPPPCGRSPSRRSRPASRSTARSRSPTTSRRRWIARGKEGR